MKPSEKAIEATKDKMDTGVYEYDCHDSVRLVREALEAAYAIDVDPLIEQKDTEIERLQWLLATQRVENERLANRANNAELDHYDSVKHISELEAENERLRDLVEVYVPKTELPK